MTTWIHTTRGGIRADQIIAYNIEHCWSNGPVPEHWRIEFTCLNGLTFASRAVLCDTLDGQGYKRFDSFARAQERLHDILTAMEHGNPIRPEGWVQPPRPDTGKPGH